MFIEVNGAKIMDASYSNPIWFGRKWRIYTDHDAHFWLGAQARYTFLHDDYDGAEDSCDNRHGHGCSLADCIDQINDLDE